MVVPQVQNLPTHANEMPGLRHVVFEVNKVCDWKTDLSPRRTVHAFFPLCPQETLETMLDGLGKIRDQLASVADSAQ